MMLCTVLSGPLSSPLQLYHLKLTHIHRHRHFIISRRKMFLYDLSICTVQFGYCCAEAHLPDLPLSSVLSSLAFGITCMFSSLCIPLTHYQYLPGVCGAVRWEGTCLPQPHNLVMCTASVMCGLNVVCQILYLVS